MKKLWQKWREICSQDNIEHLNNPRGLLFCWGALLLVAQTSAILVGLTVFLQIALVLWTLLYLLFRQYYRIWKRYYSLVWPILAQVLSAIAAIYIKVRFL